MTYDALEHISGVLRCTIKAWRGENLPGLASIEACLGALGWSLVPVPMLDQLPPDAADALATLSQYFRSAHEAYGFALNATATWPEYARGSVVKDGQRRRRSVPAAELARKAA